MAVKKKNTTAEATEEKVETTVTPEAGEPENGEPETPEVTEGATAEAPVTETPVAGETTEETVDTETADTEESGAEPTVTVDATAETQTPEKVEKMVKIKPNCNHRFYYGTQWYTLHKDVVTTVPVEVKDRLQNAGKLSAL